MSSSLQLLQPQLRPWATWLLEVARQSDAGAQITSTGRSWEEQWGLWTRYERGLSKYPAAPPGSSKHELGLAFDLLARDDVLEYLGQLWERYGGRWGGQFHDPIHFEI